MLAGSKAIARGVAAIQETNRRTHTRLVQVNDEWWYAYEAGPTYSKFGPVVEVDLEFLVTEVLSA